MIVKPHTDQGNLFETGSSRKAIIFDLDGTLLTSRKQITDTTRSAVNECVRAGYVVVIATARPYRAVWEFIPDLLDDCWLVLSNGARTMRGGVIEDRIEIPPGSVTALLESLQLEVRNIAVEADDRLYASQPETIPFDRALLLSALPPVAACKILVMTSSVEEQNRVHSLLSPDFISVVTDGGSLMQISRRECTKATASMHILEREHVSPEATYAFGDDTNDISLFRAIGYGIAMANGVPELKAVAQDVTASNDEEGVSRYLRRHILT